MWLLDENKQPGGPDVVFHPRETTGVIGFAGHEGPPDSHAPIGSREHAGADARAARTRSSRRSDSGRRDVKVADGPFQNQSGIVEEIDPERGKLRVSVSIFGRNTPVELEYWQVEKEV